MLEVARQKGKSKGVQVKWIERDMRSFNLLDRASIEDCLFSVQHHLESDGRFIVSIFVPSPALLEGHSSEEELFAEYSDPETGKR